MIAQRVDRRHVVLVRIVGASIPAHEAGVVRVAAATTRVVAVFAHAQLVLIIIVFVVFVVVLVRRNRAEFHHAFRNRCRWRCFLNNEYSALLNILFSIVCGLSYDHKHYFANNCNKTILYVILLTLYKHNLSILSKIMYTFLN